LGTAEAWQKLERECLHSGRAGTGNIRFVPLCTTPDVCLRFYECIGSAIVAGGAFVFLLAILGSLFLWRVGAEDKLMTKQFPKECPLYKKWMKALILFVW
jgi:hypothetical protein